MGMDNGGTLFMDGTPISVTDTLDKRGFKVSEGS